MYKNECVPQDENHFSALDIFLLMGGLCYYLNRNIPLCIHGFLLQADNHS